MTDQTPIAALWQGFLQEGKRSMNNWQKVEALRIMARLLGMAPLPARDKKEAQRQRKQEEA